MNKFCEYIGKYTEGKSVCILGFGREGKSTYKILKKYGKQSAIAIADLNPVDRSANELPENIELICGKEYQQCLDRFDMVFKSPGIVLEKPLSEIDSLITCETQVFFEVYREQIIGITGTKGKSTVTSLIYHVLNESGVDCRIAGNIGIPVFDIAEGMNDDTVVVCELSCHQLEYMTVSPRCAVFLNLYEEHLDHYGSMENYYNAKKNIYLHQDVCDVLWCNSEILTDDIPSIAVTVSNTDDSADVYVADGIVYDSDDEEYEIPVDRIKLLGTHNHYNIAIAWDVCKDRVEEEDFTEALCSFDPLAHRLEYVNTVCGIRWYDDSISTACATAISALQSVPNVGTILIGGMDRGIDYAPLVEFLADFDVRVICMEASGRRVYDMIQTREDFSDKSRVHYADHLDGAVKLAAEITPEGMSCVMSPAAASYGIFKNFEERGDAFKKLVNELSK
ncbi:UDP-N-acetylmuramoyl-L-alanine--D-glutamate ligase [Ruminococcus flavefaciens]|uniref:UDP-N-acetylmuramoyl-L-alanine--D-glutamate ligase n=1 Tax=Ruminococcus flavefaciens TaxID=1265 RepID=UPI0026F35337|nr:UDP-N-acetylmuramoyl-L-alanine--D-glutamate ligase [Ruminococcus flavefaciens]MDD7517493.1 UDP-N-acetylmuramoyl-L-alanine--D-glutamate ligase [Ruminococcus flavefaciens]MDY5691464.1 UDP-N-acetylmuramoyl-L-alanine--D-glutamate ligase [Ruminococcus flavefaciens]